MATKHPDNDWRAILKRFLDTELCRLNVAYSSGVTIDEDIGNVPSLAATWDIPRYGDNNTIGRSFSVLERNTVLSVYAAAWVDNWNKRTRYISNIADDERIRIPAEAFSQSDQDTLRRILKELVTTTKIDTTRSYPLAIALTSR